MEQGSIVYLKNIIFDTTGGFRVDHAYSIGRPCVYIGEAEEKMYFVTLQSTCPGNANQLCIKPEHSNGLSKITFLNPKNIIEKPLCFIECSGMLYDDEFYNVCRKLVLYYKEPHTEKSSIVVKISKEYIEKYEDQKTYRDEQLELKKTKATKRRKRK